MKKGGKKKRTDQNWGRVKGVPPSAIIDDVRKVTPAPHIPPKETATYREAHPSLKCPICLEVLNGPVELSCGQLVCSSCCIMHLAISGNRNCPCCYEDVLSDDTVHSPPSVVLELLGELVLVCSHCTQMVKAVNYRIHLDSNCQMHNTPDSPSKHTLKEIMQAPADNPTTPMEKKAAGRILHRLLHEVEPGCSIIRVPTSGQVGETHLTTTRTCTSTIVNTHTYPNSPST